MFLFLGHLLPTVKCTKKSWFTFSFFLFTFSVVNNGIWTFLFEKRLRRFILYLFQVGFSVFLSFCLSVFLSFFISVFLLFCLSVFLPFRLSVFLSFCRSVFLSFCLSGWKTQTKFKSLQGRVWHIPTTHSIPINLKTEAKIIL